MSEEEESESKASGVGWKGAGGRTSFKTPVFLSYPKPCNLHQQSFVDQLCFYLDDRNFTGRTLGVTDYSLKSPLHAIRKLMLESYGLITIAFRRTYLEQATGNYRTDVDSLSSYDLSGTWMTSPWAQIEPAMAYQIGLPIMILRESGVVADGLLQQGVVGLYMPEFNLDDTDDYLMTDEWKQIMVNWETDVRTREDRRGEPPES